MGRQHSDDKAATVVQSSSIALLQERFRKLERVKEMREGRDLLKAVSDHEAAEISPAGAQWEQNKWFGHDPELEFPFYRNLHDHVPPSRRAELSGGMSSQGGFEPQLSIGLWPNMTNMQSLRKAKDVDVDTSLHL